MKIKAAIYVRVSTEMQEEADSLSRQIERCRQYCSFKEIEVFKIYQDVESGAVDDRISLNEMKNDMKLGLFNVLIVTELSRLSRKLKTLLEFLEELEKHSVDFISITQNIDTTSPIGRVMFKLIGIFAEFEREQTSERVRHTMYSMAKTGKFTGGVVPFGYILKEGRLFIDEEKAAKVKAAYQMYISGKTRAEISKHLSIPGTTLQRMLTTPFYTGKTFYGKRKTNVISGKIETNNKDDIIIVEGEHAAIIDENTYEIAQNIFNHKFKKKVKNTDNPEYLLGGLIECYCGYSRYGTYSGNHNYYVCGNRNGNREKIKCTAGFLRSEDFEKQIIEKIKELSIENIEITEKENNDFQKIVKLKIDKLEKLKEKRKKLMDLLLDEIISKNEYTEKEASFKDEINKLENEIEIERDKANIEKNKIINKEYFQIILKEFSTSLDRKTQKELLSILIKKIKFINDFEYEIYWNV